MTMLYKGRYPHLWQNKTPGAWATMRQQNFRDGIPSHQSKLKI